MRQVLRLLLFILTGLFAANGNAIFSQEIQPILLYDGGVVDDWWASDSSRYVFFDAANANAIEFTANLTEPNWIAYHVQTGTSEQSDLWLLQPELTPEESEAFNPAVGYSGESAYIFSSPNGRYPVFPRGDAPDDGSGIWALGLADRTTGDALDLSITLFNPFTGPSSMRIFWSDDETSFVVQFINDFGEPVIYYVGGYEDSVADASPQEFALTLDDRAFHPTYFPEQGVLDISPDGSCVLLESSEGFEGPNRLILWCPADESGSVVFDDLNDYQILAGAFAADDPTHLLLLTQEGLVAYDTETGEIASLLPEINTENTLSALFSPDALWLAYVADDDNTYLLSLADIFAAA